MKFYYCPHCGRETGHKRALGWGTFFAVLLTGGLWFLAIPFYPKRCIICGSKEKPKKLGGSKSTWQNIVLLIFVAGLIASIINAFLNKSKLYQPVNQFETTEITKITDPSPESFSVFKALLTGIPIRTLWEFEHSKYYRIMQFEKYPISSTGIGYYSPPRNVIVGLKLWKEHIMESRLIYSQNKIPDFGTFVADIFFFIASFTGVYTHDEIRDLAKKIGDRLTDKSTQPFKVKGRIVIIDFIDSPLRSYLGVVIR